jgi:Zn-dependent protease
MGWFGILALLIAGLPFGATPVNPYNFRGRFGRAVVSFAGPAVNIVLALIGLTVFALVIHPEPGEGGLSLPNLERFLFVFGVWNLCLFLFNLLPIPPLDGSAIVGNLVPGYRRWAENPANQPIFLGLFLFVFFAAGKVITPLAFDIAGAWIRLFVRG